MSIVYIFQGDVHSLVQHICITLNNVYTIRAHFGREVLTQCQFPRAASIGGIMYTEQCTSIALYIHMYTLYSQV